MANSKDNISKYATSFIGFDETSGNVIDSVGGYTGTIYNAPTRVTGWNGEGNAMSFNGTNQYVEFNDAIIPIGAKSIRFKIKTTQTTRGYIFDNGVQTSYNGNIIRIEEGTGALVYLNVNGILNTPNFQLVSNKSINDGKWHDILLTWDGSTNNNAVKMYIDDMVNPNVTGEANSTELSATYNLAIGRVANNVANYYFTGQIDQIEIYDRVISPIPDKHLVHHNKEYKYHNGTQWLITSNTEENFIQYGMSDLSNITESQWDELQGDKSLVIWTDFEDKKEVQVLVETEPFSVYDYISETPTVIAYTESTDDIVVSTTTEPYDLYDEFADEVEVLFYTDDEAVTEADLILEANYSPIDELEGDFEVVTWTDDENSDGKVLQVEGEHVPIFTYLIDPLNISGSLNTVLVQESNNSKNAKYLLTSDNQVWYKWEVDKFVIVDKNNVELLGMTLVELNSIDYSKWNFGKINIGVYLTKESLVTKLALEELIPNKTSEVSDLHFYILNTTAKIDIQLNGNTITGQLTDDDSSKVQYRVVLNGGYYYPTTGAYTALSESPTNINLTLRSQDIKISQWNDLKVEFKDSFGTVDSWEVQFMGQYNGLLFRTIDGEYYSSDIGEVLRYLDFGIIIAGQTTMEQEVVLKNQHGYTVKDVGLSVVEANLPSGVKVEFSNDGVENWQPRLPVANMMSADEEVTFRVRMRTQLDSEPRSNGTFDIYVNAMKDE